VDVSSTPNPPASSQAQDPQHPSSDPSGTVRDAATPIDELTFNTTPNQLTLLRMAFAPLVVGLLFIRTPTADLWAGWLFALASATDYFDGYIARKQKIVTVYGKLLDPLADKFLVVSGLIMLQYLDRIHPVVVILLICREMAITGLRALASAEGVIISASRSAKWKTGTQMTAIPWIMGYSMWGIPLFEIGTVLLYISLAISLWSAQDYVVDFFRGVKKRRELKAADRKNARAERQARREERRARRAAAAKGTPTA
jgi:CDP-diacylglycerol--glycerol-3-phosphate 3-phosphatidyltransferase